jgi:hypothetical protein
MPNGSRFNIPALLATASTAASNAGFGGRRVPPATSLLRGRRLRPGAHQVLEHQLLQRDEAEAAAVEVRASVEGLVCAAVGQ